MYTAFDLIKYITDFIDMSMRFLIVLISLFLFPFNALNSKVNLKIKSSSSDLIFNGLPIHWDNGLPLGNSVVGTVVWQKDTNVRFSLDRIDLWDLRPSGFSFKDGYDFGWVKQKIKDNNYEQVQKVFDVTYDESPAPSKIPGAALEFSTSGKIKSSRLYLKNALCEIKWDNDVVLRTFVHAEKPIGWFFIDNCPDDLELKIIPPKYVDKNGLQNRNSLSRLGYSLGVIHETDSMFHYHQNGWGNFFYDVAVKWKRYGNTLYGVWGICSSYSEKNILEELTEAFDRGWENDYNNHTIYWDNFWNHSSVVIPDIKLQSQYDREMYKFGALAKEDSYPISLQGVWTVDNGLLPPWKGDYHHDLNTELSYWPAYTGNYLEEAKGYLNTLWNQRDTYRKFTKDFFGKDGLNIPGVCTLSGEPMGGWIQYAMSQTTSAWLAFHFYLQWKYSKDNLFLKNMAYPFVKEVAVFLKQQTYVDKNGIRTLEYSSSPEMNNNSKEAWFDSITNYDLSLLYKLFDMAGEMAEFLDKEEDVVLWNNLKKQLPDFSYDQNGGLAIASGYPYNESHRHFSHAMAIYPLGIIDVTDSERSSIVINETIRTLEEFGDDAWNGYSYSWLANIKARALDGDGAMEALHFFVDHYCSLNSFHVNEFSEKESPRLGRPFTLEGNFAFAAGIQEMLLQSHRKEINLFPALPTKWENVSFENLRTRGAFLITAELKGGKLNVLKVVSEKGGELLLKSRFLPDIISKKMAPGEEFIYKFGK